MDSEAVTWIPLTEADLPDVVWLAGRVLVVDGGLPLAAEAPFVARRYAGDGVLARGARDGAGALVAAGAVRPGPGGGVATGMVHPDARGRGLGAALLDWALATAGSVGAGRSAAHAVTVETESLTPQAAALFGGRGLRQVFAEDVLRFDLVPQPGLRSGGPPAGPGDCPPPGPLLIPQPGLRSGGPPAGPGGCPPPGPLPSRRLPEVVPPAGIRLETWSDGTARRFFEVYAAAFAERPNFPGWSESQWRDWLTGDGEFRPELSLLAVDAAGADVGFITCADRWIVQVGVRPDQRGRRIGAALVVEVLRRLQAAGEREALLDVNVDNPAGGLYRRLGFELVGRRARFARRS